MPIVSGEDEARERGRVAAEQYLLEHPEDVPGQPLLNIGAGDMRDKGQSWTQTDFISYRVTTDDANIVYDVFKGCCCVIADELSKSGVRHFHIVVKGHEMYELIKKRLVRAKLGVNKYWSKKNHHDDFLKAISYTVKCGDYVTRRGFHQYVDQAPVWVFNASPAVSNDVKDTDKDWMFTYNNLLRVCINWRTKHNLKSVHLSDILSHITEHSRWLPSPQMLKNGIDPWYHRMFEYRVTKTGPPPAWWEPRLESSGLFKYS